jgi:hypothetical protein
LLKIGERYLNLEKLIYDDSLGALELKKHFRFAFLITSDGINKKPQLSLASNTERFDFTATQTYTYIFNQDEACVLSMKPYDDYPSITATIAYDFVTGPGFDKALNDYYQN